MNCAPQYKFFSPHAGIFYGKHDLLENLFAYKVRPATNHLPGKFETGTQNHEGIAGVVGAVEYFEWIGKEFGDDGKALKNYSGRRRELKKQWLLFTVTKSKWAVRFSPPCNRFRD